MNKDRAHANAVLHEMSTKYGRTVSQIMLRWAMQRGCAVIPGTGNPGKKEEHKSRETNIFFLFVWYLTITPFSCRAYEGKPKCL
jgi:hypothetical protein